MKKLSFLILILGILCALPVLANSSNQIKSVRAVNILLLEIKMKNNLTAQEIKPNEIALTQKNFKFSDGIIPTGAPIPVRDEKKTYLLPVNGLKENMLYKVSYMDKKEVIFKTYDEKEMENRYKGRYGNSF